MFFDSFLDDAIFSTGTGLFNGKGPLDDDILQISALFFADTPAATLSISYSATVPTSPTLAMTSVTGTVPITVGPAQVKI
jgi:hypothetical protein